MKKSFIFFIALLGLMSGKVECGDVGVWKAKQYALLCVAAFTTGYAAGAIYSRRPQKRSVEVQYDLDDLLRPGEQTITPAQAVEFRNLRSIFGGQTLEAKAAAAAAAAKKK